MFTWICQKCGSEVPPSENDCPNCRARANQPVTAPITQAPPVQAPPHVQAPPVRAQPTQPPPNERAPVETPYIPPPPPPVQPRFDPPPPFASAPPVTRKTFSPAMVAAGSALGILALLAVLYLYVLPTKTDTASENSATLDSPEPSGPAAATTTHPLAKYIEITGVRIIEQGKGQVKIAYLVVNHSPADLPELQTQLTLGAAGKTIFEFPAKIPSIGPYESKDLSASLKTRLQPYELPDWQKLIPTLRITGER